MSKFDIESYKESRLEDQELRRSDLEIRTIDDGSHVKIGALRIFDKNY